jgi:hypothetical protein
VHGSIAVPVTASFWKKLLAFAGPGYLVAVGYMDPGNWATDIAGAWESPADAGASGRPTGPLTPVLQPLPTQP